MTRTLLAVLLVLVPTAASARDCLVWGERTLRNRDWPYDTKQQTYCKHWNQTYRLPEGETYSYGPPRSIDIYRSAERQNCRDVRRVVGDQHLTVDGAKKAANDAWAGNVRFHLGEVWMSLENARQVVYTCSRSSIKEGGVTTLGQTLTRCEIEAVPCRAPREGEER